MSINEKLQDFKKEVEKLREIDGEEEYAKQLAHLFLGNGLSLQTILLMAIGFGQQHHQWIPVEEELPKVGSSVLFVHPDESEPMEGYMTRTKIWWSEKYRCSFEKVTHWMPMPAPPRKEEEL